MRRSSTALVGILSLACGAGSESAARQSAPAAGPEKPRARTAPHEPRPSGAGGSAGSGAASVGAGGIDASGVAGGSPVSNSGGGSGNVTFEWPETDPSARGPCKAGRYDGGFTCSLAQGVGCDSNTGVGGQPFTGPIAITLVESMSGEFLVVSDGKLEANTVGFLFGGPITGKLDCSTREFAGELTGGYSGFLVINGQVWGPLAATYDGAALALVAGEWCMTATQPGTPVGDPCAGIAAGQPGSCLVGSCKGTWTAKYVPGT